MNDENLKAVEDKMKEKILILQKWEYEYYILDNPSVEDSVYDVVFNELKDLENMKFESESESNESENESQNDEIKEDEKQSQPTNKTRTRVEEEEKSEDESQSENDSQNEVKDSQEDKSKITLTLEGNNPEAFEGRPIKLNVNIGGDVLPLIQQSILPLNDVKQLLDLQDTPWKYLP